MTADRICPLKAGLICNSKCGLYSKLDERCSISLIAEALISVVDLRGKVFTSIVARGSRITIPLAVREDLKIEDGNLVKVVIVKEGK